jgi:hypothetical protein
VNPAIVRFVATLLFSLLTVAPGAAAQGVALLPSVGPAGEDDRRDVDTALRRALGSVDDLDLLSPVATRDNLMSLAEMGLVCLPEDVPCLVKLGIVADVAWVLVPEVGKPSGTGASRTVEIEIGVIDVAAGKRARAVDGTVALSDGDAVGALARRAMALPEKPDDKPDDKLPDDKLPDDKLPDDKLPPDDPPDAAAGPSAGVLLAGIGGVVAGVSLVGAIVSDLVFLNVIAADKDTRQNMVPVGAILWGTTAIGAITAGIGAVMLAEEAPE